MRVLRAAPPPTAFDSIEERREHHSGQALVRVLVFVSCAVIAFELARSTRILCCQQQLFRCCRCLVLSRVFVPRPLLLFGLLSIECSGSNSSALSPQQRPRGAVPRCSSTAVAQVLVSLPYQKMNNRGVVHPPGPRVANQPAWYNMIDWHTEYCCTAVPDTCCQVIGKCCWEVLRTYFEVFVYWWCTVVEG